MSIHQLSRTICSFHEYYDISNRGCDPKDTVKWVKDKKKCEVDLTKVEEELSKCRTDKDTLEQEFSERTTDDKITDAKSQDFFAEMANAGWDPNSSEMSNSEPLKAADEQKAIKKVTKGNVIGRMKRRKQLKVKNLESSKTQGVKSDAIEVEPQAQLISQLDAQKQAEKNAQLKEAEEKAQLEKAQLEKAQLKEAEEKAQSDASREAIETKINADAQTNLNTQEQDWGKAQKKASALEQAALDKLALEQAALDKLALKQAALDELNPLIFSQTVEDVAKAITRILDGEVKGGGGDGEALWNESLAAKADLKYLADILPTVLEGSRDRKIVNKYYDIIREITGNELGERVVDLKFFDQSLKDNQEMCETYLKTYVFYKETDVVAREFEQYCIATSKKTLCLKLYYMIQLNGKIDTAAGVNLKEAGYDDKITDAQINKLYMDYYGKFVVTPFP